MVYTFECQVSSRPLPSSTVSLHILYSGLSPVPTSFPSPLHHLLFGDRSSNVLPTNRQSKFHLLTAKRLFFRNHNLAILSLTLLLLHPFCHSQHDKLAAYVSPSFLLTPFFPSIPARCYLAQSPHSVPRSHPLLLCQEV